MQRFAAALLLSLAGCAQAESAPPAHESAPPDPVPANAWNAFSVRVNPGW